ncbi:Endonuclease/exonuclease/phosphatase, partial [Zopfochytrium polystomum]
MMTMSHNHSHHHHQSSAPASALSASLAVAAAAASSSPPSQPSAPTTLLPHASPPPSSSSSSSASPFLSYPAKTSFGALNSAFKLGSVADPSTSSSSSLLRIPSSSPSNLAASSGPSSLRRHQPSMPMPIAITDRSSSSSNAIPTAFGPIQQNPCSWTPSLRASFDPSSVSDDEGRFSLAQVVGGGNTSSSSSVPYSSRKQGPARHNVPLARGGIIGPALFEHGVGDDGCPVLTAPRRVFGASGGKLTVPNRVWKKGGADKVDNRHFMIMSYNVLAPLYCTESRYPECHPQFLDWDYRKHKILDEIKYHSPDFVCLQELPPSEFRESFLPELQKLGYDGHFQQKKKAHAADGSAIFYLQARFNLLAVQAFAYSDQIPHDQTSDLYQRLAPFPNVALICVFQNRQARSLRVRVVNTHLHWDPAFTDTKLLQAAILMEWLERTHRDVPTVIAADLNSRPGEVVVDYLVRGKVAPGSLFATRDFGRFSAALTYGHRPPYSGSLGAMSGSPMAKDSDLLKVTGGAQSATSPTLSPMNPPHVLPLLRHGTKLASAYDRKDLPFTNKTLDFEGSIDHILYTSGTLSIRDVLGDFDNSQLEREKHETRSDDEDMNGVMFPVELDVSDPSSSRLRSPVLLSPSDSDAKHDFCGTITEHHHTVRRSPAVPAHASPLSPSTGKPPPYPAGPAPPQPQGFLARVRSLPTENVPSDHLPLCAWLKWKTVPVGSGPFAASSSSSSSSTSSTLTSTSALSTHGPHHHQSFNNDR